MFLTNKRLTYLFLTKEDLNEYICRLYFTLYDNATNNRKSF